MYCRDGIVITDLSELLLCMRSTGGAEEPERTISVIFIDIFVRLSAKKAAKPPQT